jgi:hypothetical protein
VVPGEDFDGTGYHHHPAREAVLGWLAEAGLTIVDETEGHEYWHFLARRGRESGPRPTLPDPKPGLRAPGTGRHGAS